MIKAITNILLAVALFVSFIATFMVYVVTFIPWIIFLIMYILSRWVSKDKIDKRQLSWNRFIRNISIWGKDVY